jgi:hypothetical protein
MEKQTSKETQTIIRNNGAGKLFASTIALSFTFTEKGKTLSVTRLIRYSIYHLRIYSSPLKTETEQEKKQHI